jgi:hypothetical protein
MYLSHGCQDPGFAGRLGLGDQRQLEDFVEGRDGVEDQGFANVGGKVFQIGLILTGQDDVGDADPGQETRSAASALHHRKFRAENRRFPRSPTDLSQPRIRPTRHRNPLARLMSATERHNLQRSLNNYSPSGILAVRAGPGEGMIHATRYERRRG